MARITGNPKTSGVLLAIGLAVAAASGLILAERSLRKLRSVRGHNNAIGSPKPLAIVGYSDL